MLATSKFARPPLVSAISCSLSCHPSCRGTNCVLLRQEHAYLQVLTDESREWKFHFAEDPTKAPSVVENRGFEVRTPGTVAARVRAVRAAARHQRLLHALK